MQDTIEAKKSTQRFAKLGRGPQSDWKICLATPGSRGALWFSQTRADLELPGKHRPHLPSAGQGGLENLCGLGLPWASRPQWGQEAFSECQQLGDLRGAEALCEGHHPLSSNRRLCVVLASGDFGFPGWERLRKRSSSWKETAWLGRAPSDGPTLNAVCSSPAAWK